MFGAFNIIPRAVELQTFEVTCVVVWDPAANRWQHVPLCASYQRPSLDAVVDDVEFSRSIRFLGLFI
jgi:hypothetical protein